MADPRGTIAGEFAGRYRIERELGEGATATVFLARDTLNDRPVAVKVLRAELAQSVSADRFLREIRLTAQLHHPHIVTVLDSGEHEGMLYFVLPFLDGGTLRQRLDRERQLPIAEVVEIGRTIASALHYAHARGLIHRDVKPENILISAARACLADFGIARALEHLSDNTSSSGLVRGTAAYMSPEQASGELDYDGRSDIYSLGCVLYELLAGVAPFVGPTAQSVMAQRFVQPPRPVSMYRPEVPRALEVVIQLALKLAPAERYRNAGEMANDLARVPAVAGGTALQGREA